MRRAVGLVAAALALALAACGSSGGARDTASESSRSTSTTSNTPAADRRLATAALLQRSDLPGWAVRRTGAGATEVQDLARGIPGCESLVAGLRDGRVQERSPRFSQHGTTVDSDVDVYATGAELRSQLELYRDPSIVGCLQSLFTKALESSAPAGATVESVSVSPIAVEDVGDGGYGFRLTATVTENGVPQTVLSDIVGVTIGRVGVSLRVSAADTADLARTETTLLPLVAHRVRNAGG